MTTDSSPSAQLLPPQFLPAIDAVLAEFLAARRTELAQLDARLASTADRIGEFLAGGKRIRPGFCWWGWRAGGGRADVDDCSPVVRVAAALELIQACALLHDDLIDRSETRRGRPAMHRALSAEHAAAGWIGEAAHFGSSMALLFGDLALAWADDLFLTGASALQAAVRAQPIWQAMRTEVLGGQLLDLLTGVAPATDPVRQRTDAMTVIQYKTAAYTVVRPLQLGAALAGADRKISEQLGRYGHQIGTAFQLRDDLLGVFGDPQLTGKPAGDDLTEGKRTLLLALARQQLLTSEEHSALTLLDAGIVSRPTQPADVQRLRDIISSSSAPQLVEESIEALIGSGIAELEDVAEPVHTALTGWARAAARRLS